MAVLLRTTLLAAPVSLAADLARYGTSARWRGVYYRGEKIGFSVSQTLSAADGFEIQEDGQLQLSLMGATTPARVRTSVKVDKAFELRSFAFSLDPGTGPLSVEGSLSGLELKLAITSKAGARTETRRLTERPSLALNLPRQLAAEGLAVGKHIRASVFDPATLRNATMTVDVLAREVVRVGERPVPAFKLRTQFSGITSSSWVTETGEVVREESPLGMIVVQEPRERATAIAVPTEVRDDMYRAAAVVPNPDKRIDDPLSVDLLRLRVTGIDTSGLDLAGVGQSWLGSELTLRDAETLPPVRAEADLAAWLAPEAFLESDAPEIVAEAERATSGISAPRARAERLVRHVNGILEKRPTVSLPSALEVLRTRVGDCNEHTALYVALARAAKLPSRIAVGLVYLRGAFYYHAWAEVWIEARPGVGRWIPADPTLNQFPADLTHVRLARGGLDRQAAILQVMGRLQLGILDVQVKPGTTPILVGRGDDTRAPVFELPVGDTSSGNCRVKPRP
jgi:hypothetical protein